MRSRLVLGLCVQLDTSIRHAPQRLPNCAQQHGVGIHHQQTGRWVYLEILSEYLTLEYLVHLLNQEHQLRWFGCMIPGIFKGFDK